MKNYTTIPDRSDIFAARCLEAMKTGAMAQPLLPADPYPMPTVTEVLRTYTIAPYEWRTFETLAGMLAVSMTVTHPTDAASRFVVMFDAVTGEWTAQCPSRRHDHAPVIIEAARRHYAMQAN